MTIYEIILSGLTIALSVVAILMLLQILWTETRSSLRVLMQTKIALEELELRIARLDAILEKIEGRAANRNVSE